MGEVSIPYAVVGTQARRRGCRFPRSALIDRAEERWHDGDRDSTPFRRPVWTAAFTNSRGTVKLRCNAYPPGSRRTASCTAGRRRGSRIRVWPSGPFSTTDCAAALSVGAALSSGRRALRRIAAAGSSSGHEPTTKASCRLVFRRRNVACTAILGLSFGNLRLRMRRDAHQVVIGLESPGPVPVVDDAPRAQDEDLPELVLVEAVLDRRL